MDNSSIKKHYIQYLSGKLLQKDGNVITETPVVLSVNGIEWLTFMCSPTDLVPLGIGFLFNEKHIQIINEVESAQVCNSGKMIDIWLNHDVKIPHKWRKTSGCSGGTTSISGLNDQIQHIKKNIHFFSTQKLLNVVKLLYDAQILYRKSGGVHTTILSDGERTIFSSEDIGRHNTLDKIAGQILLEKRNIKSTIIATTGRISSEMLQKSVRINAQVVISRTSPSSLSITMAEEMGIILIGYARRNQFRIYTHSENIITR
jgi:FdhD protein